MCRRPSWPQAGIDRRQINGLAVKAFRREAGFAAGLLNNVDRVGTYAVLVLLRWIKASGPALSFDIHPKPPCLSRGLGMRDQP